MRNQGQYLNLQVVEHIRCVYRFVSLKRLFELFDRRENVLVSPSRWDDPFENFILSGQRLSRHAWYGQCWTRHRASDAMWRIYSRDETGVRIRSNPRRLVDSLNRAGAGVKAFIGCVRYPPRKDMVRFASKALKPGYLAGDKNVAETLLVKRRAFRHEGEVRLLVRSDGSSSGDLFKYDVDPNTLVDQLMLHPRLSAQEAYKARDRIRVKTGFSGQIKRSLLYEPPPLLMA